jgi:hypothetical protein
LRANHHKRYHRRLQHKSDATTSTDPSFVQPSTRAVGHKSAFSRVLPAAKTSVDSASGDGDTSTIHEPEQSEQITLTVYYDTTACAHVVRVRTKCNAHGTDAASDQTIKHQSNEYNIGVAFLQTLAKDNISINLPVHGDAGDNDSVPTVPVNPRAILTQYANMCRQPTYAADEYVSAVAHDRTSPPTAAVPYLVECVVCEQQFETAEESRAHFAACDHEIAMVMAVSGARATSSAVDNNVVSMQQQQMLACPSCPKSFMSKVRLCAR